MTTINDFFEVFINTYIYEVHSWPAMNFIPMCEETTREYHGYIRLHHY